MTFAADYFKKGDHVKSYLRGTQIEEVCSTDGPCVYTFQGNTYHITKIMKVAFNKPSGKWMTIPLNLSDEN